MTDTNTTPKAEAPVQEAKPAKSVFADLLAKTNFPAQALAPMEAKLVEAFDLIVENNKRVAAVNAAKAQDPNNTEHLDALWKLHASTDPEIAPLEEQFQLIQAQHEKLLSQLRELGKKHIQPVLSEDDAKNTRKLVNESAPTIAKAKQSAKDMADIVDNLLEMVGAKPEGGVLSLLPEVESLKNARGRKASTASGDGKVYMTRVGDILLDGKSTNREVNGEMKGKFNYAADELSKRFGVEIHGDNEVTAEELEVAFYEALGLPWRSLKSTEIPKGSTFDFTKTIKVRNGNDDSFKDVPQTVKVTVEPTIVKPTVTATTTETPKATETEKAEPATPEKVEAKVETPKTESKAPAKQTQAAPKK